MPFTLPPVNNSATMIAPGYYLLTLKEMVEEPPRNPGAMNRFGQEEGPRCRWVFLIDRCLEPEPTEEQEAAIGQEFWAWSSISMGRKAKMREYAQALLGRELDDGEQVADHELISKRVKTTIVEYDKESGGKGTKIGTMAPYKALGQTATSSIRRPPEQASRPASEEDVDSVPF